MMKKWGPQRLRGGSIAQAGLNVQDRYSYTARRTVRGGLYRGVIIRSYVHDDEDNLDRLHKVTSDVFLVHSQVPLYRVPVMQRNYGINNVHGLWVPRGTTRALDGGELNFTPLSRRGSPTPGDGATGFDNIDGDHVLVAFIEGDLDMPIVVGALDHERSNRQAVTPAGAPEYGVPQKDEFYIHHYGTEMRISAEGDLLIDALNAYGKTNAEEGEEDATQGSGEIRMRVKEDRRVTIEVNGTDVLEVWNDGGQVRIDLGEGAAERLVLGDAFRSFFNDILSALDDRWTQLFNIHVHADPASGVTGTPQTAAGSPLTVGVVPPNTLPLLDEMAEALLSDLAFTKKS